MPDPAISPTTIGQTSYTTVNSKSLTVELSLLIPNIAPWATFQVEYPTAAAGVNATLTRAGLTLGLIPPVDDRTTFANRRVISAVTPTGANTILNCEIRATAMGGVTEAWTVRVTGMAGSTCKFT